jgi:5-methylcytosine-specific restriction enzyme subunit McrC
MGLPPRVSSVADIDAFHGPLTEWVSRQFLVALDYLTKRGVRFEYHSEEDQQRYLRGRLLIDRQVREPPGRRYCFHIRHDVFDANRPENRLIQSALGEVLQHTADPGNWRLARELSGLWADVPASTNVGEDFSRWRSERLLAHYEPVRSWTRLILEQMTPMSMIGKWSGNSMLFPMERLFETYVGTCLGRSAPAGTSVKRSASTEHLCQHRGEPLFLLKPDFLVSNKSKKRILDTKWKLLDSRMNDATGKYGLAQSDFYQMLAYGQKYLGGKGDMFLIFPRTRQFSDSLPEFRFTEDLRLWVVPFDLETDSLVGVAAEALWILDAA